MLDWTWDVASRWLEASVLAFQLLLCDIYWFLVFRWYACLKKSPVPSRVGFCLLVKIWDKYITRSCLVTCMRIIRITVRTRELQTKEREDYM